MTVKVKFLLSILIATFPFFPAAEGALIKMELTDSYGFIRDDCDWNRGRSAHGDG